MKVLKNQSSDTLGPTSNNFNALYFKQDIKYAKSNLKLNLKNVSNLKPGEVLSLDSNFLAYKLKNNTVAVGILPVEIANQGFWDHVPERIPVSIYFLDDNSQIISSFDIQASNIYLSKFGSRIHYLNYFEENWDGAEISNDKEVYCYSVSTSILRIDDRNNTYITYSAYGLNRGNDLVEIESSILVLDSNGEVVLQRNDVNDIIFSAAISSDRNFLAVSFGNYFINNSVQHPFTLEILDLRSGTIVLEESFEDVNDRLLGVIEILPNFFQVTVDPYQNGREEIFIDLGKRALYRGKIDEIDIGKFYSWNYEGITLKVEGRLEFHPYSSFLRKHFF
ncbi:MAG: hypothetical protein ABIV51_00405 [Saprospiraceae bacterium]